MNMNVLTSPPMSDEQFWRLSMSGDREAFGKIVERYQVLICSLAFSACGSVAASVVDSLVHCGRAGAAFVASPSIPRNLALRKSEATKSKADYMPVISKFYGIVIRMLMIRPYMAHFHAFYDNCELDRQHPPAADHSSRCAEPRSLSGSRMGLAAPARVARSLEPFEPRRGASAHPAAQVRCSLPSS
jgi:hypothetical protein